MTVRRIKKQEQGVFRGFAANSCGISVSIMFFPRNIEAGCGSDSYDTRFALDNAAIFDLWDTSLWENKTHLLLILRLPRVGLMGLVPSAKDVVLGRKLMSFFGYFFALEPIFRISKRHVGLCCVSHLSLALTIVFQLSQKVLDHFHSAYEDLHDFRPHRH